MVQPQKIMNKPATSEACELIEAVIETLRQGERLLA
jgi:hypothetical protein